ncbi:carboxypeptidase-like regulatory domain-containing protein, partial [candidate division KSB1 bacterium]
MVNIFRNWILTAAALIILGSAAVQAQNNNHQTDKNTDNIPAALFSIITLNLNNVSLEEALNELSVKSGIKLNYIISDIFRQKTVSVNKQNTIASEVLMDILNRTGTGLRTTKDGLLIIIPAKNSYAEITGIVTDNKSGLPLSRVNVIIKGTQLGAATDSSGGFIIRNVSPGIYSVEASTIGYETKVIENISIKENETVELQFELNETTLLLSEIVVTPGHFTLMEDKPASYNVLESEDLRDFPQLGEDIFRAVKRLPGLSGNDFSAKFAVRGGEHDEVLVMLDGLELHDPFHLKAVGGGLSIIDVELINSIDMITGAFPAEYGNKLSGVFNMQTRTPTSEKPRTSLAISFLNTRFLTEGTFKNGKGSWQLLARRGYIEYILKLMEEENNVKPVYYDIYSKMQYFLNPDHLISAH